MSFAAFVLPASSSLLNHSLSVKSAHFGLKQFPGCDFQSLTVPHIVQKCSDRDISSSVRSSSFFSSHRLANYPTTSSPHGRARKVCAGTRSRLSSSGSRQGNAGPELFLPCDSPVTESEIVRRGQSLEAVSSSYPGGKVGKDGSREPLPPMADSSSVQQGAPVEDTTGSGSRQRKALESSLPTMEDIVEAAAEQGVKLQVKSFGPTFQIIVSSLDGDKMFGKADGWVTVWTKGKILHLESVKLERGLSKVVGNIFGAGIFVGASTLRYGLDKGCKTAELMAIYDDQASHSKLVKYYNRLGFKTVYDVDEEDWKYFADRVVWGGVGTRMDADCEELLRKWSTVLKPKRKSWSITKESSSKLQNVQ